MLGSKTTQTRSFRQLRAQELTLSLAGEGAPEDPSALKHYSHTGEEKKIRMLSKL